MHIAVQINKETEPLKVLARSNSQSDQFEHRYSMSCERIVMPKNMPSEGNIYVLPFWFDRLTKSEENKMRIALVNFFLNGGKLIPVNAQDV